MSIGMEGGKNKLLISCINQLRNNKIMTHSTKYTCATSKKCGTRPRAWNRNTKARLVQDTTLCPECGAHTYRPGLELSLSQRADKPTFYFSSRPLHCNNNFIFKNPREQKCRFIHEAVFYLIVVLVVVFLL
jgi:hypothetical protein